jgi:hypothetical protein
MKLVITAVVVQLVWGLADKVLLSQGMILVVTILVVRLVWGLADKVLLSKV